MEAYELMPAGTCPPYAMLANPSCYQSKEINTDAFGFRVTPYQDKHLSIENIMNYESVNFLVGGSTVFGVGSSNDFATISAYLGEFTNEPWVNLGLRGGVSFQEYIHFIQHFKKARKIKNVVFFSGINDIYRNFIDNRNAIFDKRFQTQNDQYSFNSARRISLAYLKSIVTQRTVQSYLDTGADLDIKLKEKDIRVTAKENIEKIFNRNFHLYNALASYDEFKLTYFIQPFLPLTRKVPSEKEVAATFRNEKLQENTKWLEVKDRIISNFDDIKIILFKLAHQYSIPIYNTSPIFSTEDSLFTDNVHLTDAGCKLAARFISENV